MLKLLSFIALASVVIAQDCANHPGAFQSPIDIDTSAAVKKQIGYVQFSRSYTRIPKSMTLTNVGYTFNLEVESRDPLKITFPLFPHLEYEFVQIHFHWSENEYEGSEHTINNRTYPLEMHAVHAQTTDPNYPTYVVLGYFFNLVPLSNRPLERIVNKIITSAKNPNRPISILPFPLSQLYSVKPFPYYTYEGSLTTPPYDEQVRWVVANEPLRMSRRQLNVFHQAAEIETGMVNNYRCVQDLENRVVIFNP